MSSFRLNFNRFMQSEQTEGQSLFDFGSALSPQSTSSSDLGSFVARLQGNQPTPEPQPEPELPNIVDIATGSDDFNLLVRALSTAGLVETIQNAPDLTVFAPTDAAFTALAVDLGFEGDQADEGAVFGFIVEALTELGGGDPIPLLTDILLYHVSPHAKTAAQIDAQDQVSTLLEGATFGTEGSELIDNEPDVANPNIVTPDLAASNGIVQVLDRVLLPIDIPGNEPMPEPEPEPELPTLTGLVSASGGEFDRNSNDFDLLLNAVQAADLAGVLDDPNADLTVFAPNDAAFVGLAQTLGFDGRDEGEAFSYIVKSLSLLSGGGDPIPLLTDILLYHVAPGARDADSVLSSDAIPTLLGVDLGVNGTSLVDQDPDVADPNIIATNVEASNGIGHAIDGVLLPVDLLAGDGGGGTVDFLIGDDGNNRASTGVNTDFVSGEGGNDVIRLGAGDDVGLGGAGNDRLSGGSDNDRLDGGEGRDLIDGGRGDDALVGGADGDVFVFRTGGGSDVIEDFTVGEDLIRLQAGRDIGFEDISGRISDGETGAEIDLGSTQITLTGVSASDLSESDFQFH